MTSPPRHYLQLIFSSWDSLSISCVTVIFLSSRSLSHRSTIFSSPLGPWTFSWIPILSGWSVRPLRGPYAALLGGVLAGDKWSFYLPDYVRGNKKQKITSPVLWPLQITWLRGTPERLIVMSGAVARRCFTWLQTRLIDMGGKLSTKGKKKKQKKTKTTSAASNSSTSDREKCYDHGDPTLQFVDGEDEMDCKSTNLPGSSTLNCDVASVLPATEC